MSLFGIVWPDGIALAISAVLLGVTICVMASLWNLIPHSWWKRRRSRPTHSSNDLLRPAPPLR